MIPFREHSHSADLIGTLTTEALLHLRTIELSMIETIFVER
jgi:hypothetical protein